MRNVEEPITDHRAKPRLHGLAGEQHFSLALPRAASPLSSSEEGLPLCLIVLDQQ